jgi:hypothetical protein
MKDQLKYTELNIKSGMPIVADALRYLQDSITRLKREKYDVVTIVHGYGSTGQGGAICVKARQWLKAQERNGKLKRVIFGEDFTLFNFDALALKNQCRALEPLLRVCNNGVTVVEL